MVPPLSAGTHTELTVRYPQAILAANLQGQHPKREKCSRKLGIFEPPDLRTSLYLSLKNTYNRESDPVHSSISSYAWCLCEEPSAIMDPGTILGLVSLILQVIGGVDKVIQSFDRMQNAPRELRDFSYSIKRLDRKFKDFQKDVQASTDILHAEDIEQIEETLTLCASLFHRHEERQREGVVNVVLRSMWSSGNNEKLAKYKARIDEHYSTILVPGWAQLSLQLLIQ